MRCLVVPTDFSAFAQEALRYADAIRRQAGAEIHLLHVASPTEPASPPGEDATREAIRQAAEAAGVAQGTLTSAIRTSYAIAPTILTYADEIGADTVVVGTHGRRGFRRFMMGSVAEELVRTSPVDVLVVPRGGAPVSGLPGRRVLAAADLHEGTDPLLAHARDLAGALDSDRLDLLHVLEPLPYPIRWLDETLMNLVPDVRNRAAEELRQHATSLAVDPGGVYVEVGVPAPTIARTAEALDSDLIVVAPHARGRMERALLGSVAGDVARVAERPVLVAWSVSRPDA